MYQSVRLRRLHNDPRAPTTRAFPPSSTRPTTTTNTATAAVAAEPRVAQTVTTKLHTTTPAPPSTTVPSSEPSPPRSNTLPSSASCASSPATPSTASSSLVTTGPTTVASTTTAAAAAASPSTDFAIWRQQEECRRACFRTFRRIATAVADPISSPTATLNALKTLQDILIAIPDARESTNPTLVSTPTTPISPNATQDSLPNVHVVSTLGFISVFEDDSDNQLLTATVGCIDRYLNTLIQYWSSQETISNKPNSTSHDPTEIELICRVATHALINLQGLLLLNYDSKLAFADKKLFSVFFTSIRDLLSAVVTGSRNRASIDRDSTNRDRAIVVTIAHHTERIVILMAEAIEACVVDCSYANRKFESTAVLSRIRDVLQSTIFKSQPTGTTPVDTSPAIMEDNTRQQQQKLINADKIKRKILEVMMLYLFPENEYPDWVEHGRSTVGHKGKKSLKIFNQAATDSLLKESLKEAQRLQMANTTN